MPKALEMALKKQAKSKGLAGDRANAYVYGTLRKTGWTPGQPTPSVPHKVHSRSGR